MTSSIRPAIGIGARGRGTHTKFIHFHTIFYRGEVLPRPHPVTHKLHTIFIQYHTHNRPEAFTIKDGCCLILFRLELGLSED